MRYLLLLFSTLVFNSAYAIPLIYQFDGNINSYTIGDVEHLTNGDSINVGNVIFTIGEAMQYRIYVDFSRPGYCTIPNPPAGERCNGQPIADRSYADFFYANLISATKLTPISYQNSDYHFGRSDPSLYFPSSPGLLEVESAVDIKSFSNIVQDWVEGMSLLAVDTWSAGSDIPNITSTMTLTSITAVPVPEPGTLTLLIGGLGLITFTSRFKASNNRLNKS